MLADSVKRDIVEEIIEKSRRWLGDYVEHSDEPIPDDVLLHRDGVEEILAFFDDKALDELLYKATAEVIEEIKDDLKAARDYPEQVRRDYARAVGFRY